MSCCAAAMGPREEITRDFQKTVALPNGRSFRIEHSLGNVNIDAHARGEVEIHASLKCSADRAEEARRWCDQIKIAVEETSSEVWVRTEYPHDDLFGGRHNLSYSVSYDIAIPETAPLEVRNRFGAVSVSNLHAAATINNGNGRVVFSKGRGQQRIENTFGSVEVAGNDGDVTVVNTNGPVTASDITGALNIRNHFGEVRVTHAGKRVDIDCGNCTVGVTDAGGPASIANTFGAVTVRDVRGDVTVQNQNGRVEATGVAGTADLRTSFAAVRFSRIGKGLKVRAQNSTVTGDTVGESAAVETSFGGIDLRGVKGGARATAGNSAIRLVDIGDEVYAKTTFAGVTVEDAAGPITVENGNGSVAVRAKKAPKCQPVSVNTTFGPIRVTIPPRTGYDVSARTTFGHITSQPAVTVSGPIGGDSLTGKIGSGGCQLKLSDQNGIIEILN